MNDREFQVMFEREGEHWWYAGLHALTLRTLRSRLDGHTGPLRVLDAGCGTGRLLELLAGEPPGRFEARGLEFAGAAIPYLLRRGLSGVVRGSVAAMPYASQSFDALVSHDVVSSIDPPAIPRALGEFRRVLRPGGMLLMNLPAYGWLRSRHDRAVDTRTRFSASGVEAMLTAAGFGPIRVGHRNMALFPAVAAVRLLQKLADRNASADAVPGSDLALPPRPINAALGWPLRLENTWIARGGRLPFGLSLWIEAMT